MPNHHHYLQALVGMILCGMTSMAMADVSHFNTQHYDTRDVVPSGQLNKNSGSPAGWGTPIHDNQLFSQTKIDQLGYQGNDNSPDEMNWDAKGWIGTDMNRLWWKTEGNGSLHHGGLEKADVQLLYGRTLTSFWNLQLGARESFKPKPNRHYAVIGLEGLAPQWIDTDASLYISDQGKVSAETEFEYELLLTQKLILEPSVSIEGSFQNNHQYDTGKGVNSLDLDLDLKYQITRKLTPYIGFEHSHDYDEHTTTTALLVGLSGWY